jgi:hypothetical protein
MSTVEWAPIAEKALSARVKQGVARMNRAQVRLWQAICVTPEKWQQHPYGEPGGGFWVVALIGRTVIWYNDLEEGFNRSRYVSYGMIEDYWRNDDELELTVQYLMDALERGTDLVLMPEAHSKVFP